jgi:hypothetical protein
VLYLGLGTEFRSEKIPRNRLGTVSVIPRKKVLIPRHSEFRGRANSEARNGREFRSSHSATYHPLLGYISSTLGYISSTYRLHLIRPRLHPTLHFSTASHSHSATYHPLLGYIISTLGYISSTSRLHHIHTRLHLIHTRLYLINNRLHIIHTRLHLIHYLATYRPHLGYISSTTRLHLIHTRLHLIHTRLPRLHLIHTWLHLIYFTFLQKIRARTQLLTSKTLFIADVEK